LGAAFPGFPSRLRYFSQRAPFCGRSGADNSRRSPLVAFAQQNRCCLQRRSVLAGLGCGPAYHPIYVTWLAARFPKDDATWLAAPLFPGPQGFGRFPHSVARGVVASQTHSLRFGFILAAHVRAADDSVALRACPSCGQGASNGRISLANVIRFEFSLETVKAPEPGGSEAFVFSVQRFSNVRW